MAAAACVTFFVEDLIEGPRVGGGDSGRGDKGDTERDGVGDEIRRAAVCFFLRGGPIACHVQCIHGIRNPSHTTL